MRRPARLWEQYQGKAFAELIRGSGRWPLQIHPCALEPPWDPYEPRSVSLWDCVVNDWDGPWEGSWLRRVLFPDQPLRRPGETLILPEVPCPTWEGLVRIVAERFPEDEATIPKAEQFLLALPGLTRPLAFEIVGMGARPEWDSSKTLEILDARARGEKRRFDEAICGWSEPYTVAQFVAHQADAPMVQAQLLAHYPNSAVVIHDDLSDTMPGNDLKDEGACGAILSLRHYYCHPLRVFGRLDPDPLSVAIATMEHLDRRQWAMLQVLFQPATSPWTDTLTAAVTDPYKGTILYMDVSEPAMREKFSTPLFAVAVRILASHPTIFRQLEGWAEQFAAPPQGLAVLDADGDYQSMDDFDRESFAWDVDARCTHRPGILLNLHELASLIHLPSDAIASERLRRVKSRTRPVPVTVGGQGSVILGENLHRGQMQVARIPAGLRARHCYVAGASGTGKSTLLLNMILQDIHAGHGVGVLDPHGDLIGDVLKRIPAERVDDVILFDPSDEEYPFALNILDAKDDAERERIVAETVMALERYFPSSWGPRLERILTYTIHTVLHAIPGATLADVERMLIDQHFRTETIARTKDPRFLQFWNEQFRYFPKNATDPVLNKISVFLLSRTVRNIICQRHSAIDFDEALSARKILLANLSTGLLTEKIAGMLGSFLVTKIVNAAFRRARLPEEKRRPWYLYVDEFQAFMNLSVGFDRILAEARKYRLVLAGLANQYVGQLSPAVRQAIFGNVGTLVVFRLGVDDANLVAKEMGAFTAEELLNLELGQAIVRTGTSATAFNLQTYPEPARGDTDHVARIVALTRKRYTSPRKTVEAGLGDLPEKVQAMAASWDSPDEPTDPSEDDLVR